MSAGDCLTCGGDGHLPGSLGATTCPTCGGSGNRTRPWHRFYERPAVMLALIIALLAAIGVVLVIGCGALS